MGAEVENEQKKKKRTVVWWGGKGYACLIPGGAPKKDQKAGLKGRGRRHTRGGAVPWNLPIIRGFMRGGGGPGGKVKISCGRKAYNKDEGDRTPVAATGNSQRASQ